MTYINLTKHAIERCIERHPEISLIRAKKNSIKEAKVFLEGKLRSWLSDRDGENLKRTVQGDGVIVFTDGTHKIVYTKVGMGELLVITYGYKNEINKLEWEIFKMLPEPYNSKYRRY